jgi:putative DNA primase/helicase
MTAEEIANVLGDATREGSKSRREWRARCPIHGGTAFTIRDGKDGNIIWTCWAKCDRIAIARELHRLKLLPSDDQDSDDQAEPSKDDAARSDTARWLWRRRQSLGRTLAERYLRQTRGIAGPLPCTLGFLAAYKDHPPALIAAYGLPIEPEPSLLELPLDAVQGVQLISLTADARKAGKPITIGRCLGAPIVLAPMGDNLGLAIAEGIEDAASIAEATGLGAWAAGGASRLAALADSVPAYTDCISILQDDDPAGQQGVDGLAAALMKRACWRPDQIELVRLGAREG